MNITSLSSSELMARFGKLVQTERKITHLVLECIAEIDTRRIYLERAYPSLYEFLVKEFGYSPSSAIRRIESARLLRDIPEVSEKIEAGALNLSQLSKVQQAIRTVQKIEDRQMDETEKRSLLSKIEYTTQDQTELILAQELSLPVVTEEKEKLHRDESVTLTITFTKDQMALLDQIQDLVSHSVPEKKWADTMAYLAQKELDRRTKIKKGTAAIGKISEEARSNETPPPNENVLSTATSRYLKSSGRKTIRPNLRKSILLQNKCCQYKDPKTGKTCESRRFLQIDHIQPLWAGGSNESTNLQILCAQHNQFKYKKESGLHPLRMC
ncbi:hypothetical protein D3C87_143670 [compost metagenome]